MEIIINNSILDNFKLKNQEYLVDKTYYDKAPGQQEYRLYSYLSTLFDNQIILDIGTFNGRSAIALSHNDKNKVISYDIHDHIKQLDHKIYTKKNIEFRIKNVFDDLTPELIKKTKIVVIDIDHFGNVESEIINRLDELGFSGIVLLDDIYHPSPEEREAMQRLWGNINYEKYDVTKYGHTTGTGLFLMNSNIKIKFV
jgi:predicted O-methyltransferase YrrM